MEKIGITTFFLCFSEVKKRKNKKRWTNPKNTCHEEERTFLQGIKGLWKKDISQLKCSVAMKKGTSKKNVPRRKNGRMI